MNRIFKFLVREKVLSVSLLLAIISSIFVPLNPDYLGYIDFRSLAILWSLMIIMQGFTKNNVFSIIGTKLIEKCGGIRELCTVLIMLCFFCSMLITNDVSLITFVPFAIMLLSSCEREDLMIPVLVLQTMAANLGSMLTPIGNPQNLYLYELSKFGIIEFTKIMLPYSLISLVLIVIGILILPCNKQKFENINLPTAGELSKKDLLFFSLLFVITLLTVLRVINYIVPLIAVLLYVIITDRKLLLKADYILLLTFVGFFIFTGNMGNIKVISNWLSTLISGKETLLGVLTSQIISNVPAALLLSGFTNNFKPLIIGVNIGGLGTLIASMASLITYKLYANSFSETKGKYFTVFTIYNVIGLLILSFAYVIIG